MKININIKRPLLKVWRTELTSQSDCVKKTGIARSTISNALKTGRCTKDIMNRINAYLLQQREQDGMGTKLIKSK